MIPRLAFSQTQAIRAGVRTNLPRPLPPPPSRLFSFCWLPRLQFKGTLASLACAHSFALTQLNSARPIRSSLTSVWPWKLRDVSLRRRSRLRLKLSLRRASAAIFWNPAGPSIRRMTTLWRNLQDPKSLLGNSIFPAPPDSPAPATSHCPSHDFQPSQWAHSALVLHPS